MKPYTSRDVARLLGLSLAQVRAFARADFLEPGRGPRGEYRFSFHDLVLLRTAKGLTAARIPSERIRRALRTLRKQLPRGRSLSEVRITAEGGEIVVHDRGAAWSPESGQLQLDFTVAELAGKVAPLARRVTLAAGQPEASKPLTADAWYDLALDLESYAPAEAQDAYGRAIQIDARHADAHVNLGRLLHEEERVTEAEAHYRRALDAQPAHATAAFNLGIALEDLGQPAAAARAYGQAVAADPGFADAYFNLSRLYENGGDRAAALRHLQNYRRLTERRSGS